MIIINKDADINKIGLTLREYQVAETNDFVFEFKNDFTGQIITESLTDLSTNKGRINIFCLSGETFELPGFYHYTVYQTITVDDEEINIPLEHGKLKVIENESLPSQYASQIIETNVYNGQ